MDAVYGLADKRGVLLSRGSRWRVVWHSWCFPPGLL